jgi:putative transcriptional regulator
MTNQPHVDDLLPEYAAGMLSAADAERLQAHLAGCGRCAAELGEIREALDGLALDLPALTPPPALRERILADIGRVGRFDAFAARIATLLDCAVDKARTLVGLIDQAASWVDGPFGTRLVHLPAGPSIAGANCGFIRLPPGASFPMHRHVGEERALVLQGSYLDSSGRSYGPGADVVMSDGSEHSFTALPGVDLVFLVVLEHGIEVDGKSEPSL